MYSKQEASLLRQSFWTSFGQYMALHQSADAQKINWINYKTGIKYIQFRMDANNQMASVAIEVSHPAVDMQKMYVDQFVLLKNILHNTLGEEWIWQTNAQDGNGKSIVRIYKLLSGVNIFKKEDWSSIISFLKPRIIALDDFWTSAKYSFEL